MSELRQSRATREWFVIATERAKRPKDFTGTASPREDMEYSEKCPFCPGNEEMTPDTAYVYEADGSWLVRSVPNKFSAFSPAGDRQRENHGVYRTMQGVGIHEVIIESPRHNDSFVTMKPRHIEQVIRAYVNRFNEAMQDDRIEAVMIFKNYGQSAGSSLAHPHSQMIAMPLVPAPMRRRLDAAKHYFDDMGSCVYCDMLAQEIQEEVRIITRNDSFVAFCPYASGSAFESWIMPLRHEPSFGNITREEIRDMASILSDLMNRYHYGLGDPDFNITIQTPPRDESNDRSYHWYLEVFPKLTKTAGFELGTGMLINVTLPKENARFLREVKIPGRI